MKTLSTTALFEHETISELVDVLALGVLEPWRHDEYIEPLHGALLYRSATHPDVSALLKLAAITLQAVALREPRTDEAELAKAAWLIQEMSEELDRRQGGA